MNRGVPLISESTSIEIWQTLAGGDPLDRFRLPTKDGRTDLSGLSVPDPQVLERWQTPIAEVARTESRELHGVRWRDLDFSGSRIRSFWIFSSEITNCRFDDCDLKELNPADTVFRDCSFQGANLKGSGLGIASTRGPRSGRRNSYVGVDFSAADLRGTLYQAAAFEGCSFGNTKLSNVDFARSAFVNCRFAGELREVQFWRTRPWLPEEDVFPPNEMWNVDFTRAKLRWVEFRGLNLEHVHLPNDPDHVIIEDFATVLDRLIAALKCESDEISRVLVAMLEVDRKWAVPGGRGVLNLLDFAEDGEEVALRFIQLLQAVGAKTSLNRRIN